VFVALDFFVPWNSGYKYLIIVHYKLFAQLCYLVADFLASGKRDILQSFQSRLAVYKDLDFLALQAIFVCGVIECGSDSRTSNR
jgi:hypothetical protein